MTTEASQGGQLTSERSVGMTVTARSIGEYFAKGDEVVYETDNTTIVAVVKENRSNDEFIHYILKAIKIKGRNPDRRHAGGEFRVHVRREHVEQAGWGLRVA